MGSLKSAKYRVLSDAGAHRHVSTNFTDTDKILLLAVDEYSSVAKTVQMNKSCQLIPETHVVMTK
jgi:hypothetical protein